MKVQFPLSLKVACWLVLNLVLLAATAIGFLVIQGGLSWDALVAGAPGDRLHALSSAVVGEASAATDSGRDAVLARFSRAYGADFSIVQNHGRQLAGPVTALPKEVRQRIDEGPLQGPPGDGQLGPPPERDDDAEARPGPRPDSPGPAAREPEMEANRRRHGRFLVHAGSPAQWWLGFRAPFRRDGGFPIPATVVIRAHSFWSVILLLNLESWLLIGAVVVGLSVLFWLPLVRSITSQLRALSTATERIADGQFSTRVAPGRRDELGKLAESVNTMAARLDTLVNGQRRFLADIAHELGSPIGRLQVATEILEAQANPGLAEHVADVRDEVQHMAELVNELLAFTKAGMRPRDAEQSPVPIDALFNRVLTREDPQKRVRTVAGDKLRILGDEPLLARAVGNLVRNALRYAGDSGAITLSATRENGSVTISVDDEGPGVPAAALQRLGEPFYRPESARTRETGGVGLGLAIVRSSVAASGGQVKFSNRTPRGFRAEIKLKAAEM